MQRLVMQVSFHQAVKTKPSVKPFARLVVFEHATETVPESRGVPSGDCATTTLRSDRVHNILGFAGFARPAVVGKHSATHLHSGDASGGLQVQL